MSTATATANDSAPARIRPEAAGLFQRQILGILRFELRKSLFSRRALGLYFLAWSPLLIGGLWALSTRPAAEMDIEGPLGTINVFAVIFQFYLRFPIYLSALLMFMSLFRNEVLERSLHYYFLTPVRREVLVAGKYLSALISSWVAFIVGTAMFFMLIALPWGVSELFRYLFQGPGFGNMMAYVLVAMMAVAGYGAVFMLVGQFFKNPVVPAIMIWVWELINFLLPSTLKKISVIFYLQSFYPVPPPERSLPGPLAFFRVLTDPPPAWLSIFGLVLFTGFVIVAAGWRARRMEVAYGDD